MLGWDAPGGQLGKLYLNTESVCSQQQACSHPRILHGIEYPACNGALFHCLLVTESLESTNVLKGMTALL